MIARPAWSITYISKVTHTTEEDARKCKICSEFLLHQSLYRQAREEYQKDRDLAKKSLFPVYTADMKVFLTPKLTSKEHVFVSRLVVFDETFASLNDN